MNACFFILPNEHIYNGNEKPKHFNFTHNGLIILFYNIKDIRLRI